MSDPLSLLMLAEAERDAFRDAVGIATKKLRRLERKLAEVTEERDRAQNVVIDMGVITERAINALRGPPPDDCWWSTHDLAELAEKAAALANAVAAIQGMWTFNIPELEPWQAVQADTVAQATEMIELMRQ